VSMSADHDRLDALRRLAKDWAATPAEKATARRLAKALAAKTACTYICRVPRVQFIPPPWPSFDPRRRPAMHGSTR
jgi:hypothetical protein